MARLLFLASDVYMISTGGRDACVMQWAVKGKLETLHEEDEDSQDEEDMESDPYQLDSDDSTKVDGRRRKLQESYDDRYSDEESYDDEVDRTRQVAAPQGARSNRNPPKPLPAKGNEHVARGRHNPRQLPQQPGSYAGEFNKRRQAGGASHDSSPTRSRPELQNRPRPLADADYYDDDETPVRRQRGGAGRNDRYLEKHGRGGRFRGDEGRNYR